MAFSFPAIKGLAEKHEQKIRDFFAPEPNQVRVRDVVRELPGNLSSQIGQPFMRGTAATASGLHDIGQRVQGAIDPYKTYEDYEEEFDLKLKPQGRFQKELYGTDKEITAGSYGRELRAGIGSDEEIAVDPLLGFVAGFSELIPGGRGAKETAKGATKVATKVYNKYGKTIGQQIIDNGHDLMETSLIRGKEEAVYNQLNVDKVQALSQKLSDKFSEFGRAFKETEQIRSAERGQRVAQSQDIFDKTFEETGDINKAFEASKKALGGEYGRADAPQFDLSQDEADTLFKQIATSQDLLWFQKHNAREGLRKMLGELDGKLPTPSEMDHLKTVFGTSFVRSYHDNFLRQGRSTAETIAQIANVPRALMSSADMSAPLRQGLLLSVDQPKNAVRAFGSMVRYFFDDRYFQASMEAIERSPLAKVRKAAGLELTDVSGANFSLGTKEEAYMTDLASKIPAIGTVVKASERAYSGFLNKLRADVFDDVAKEMMAGGIRYDANPEEFEGVARFINVATGRGELGFAIPGTAAKDFGKTLERSAPLMNAMFFSPRFMASRMQMFNPRWYMSLTPKARKMAARSVIKMVSTGVGISALANLNSELDVETDPRSSDFGKIRAGDFRYDIWGGFQQPMVFLSRLITGESKSTTTGKLRELDGEGPFGSSRADITGRFFRSKLAPVPSSGWDFMAGENVVGEETTIPQQLKSKLLPFMMQDILEAGKEEGYIKSGTLLSPAFFGIGTQFYESSAPGGRSGNGRSEGGRSEGGRSGGGRSE